MDSVVHFEMPAGDMKRVAKFYSSVFGWNMNQLGGEMGHYLLAETAETGEDRMIKKPGAINGGFYPKKDPAAPSMTHLVIAVGNLKTSMEKVKKSGGKIEGEIMDIPGIGSFVMFTDSEGNRVGMLQPLPRK